MNSKCETCPDKGTCQPERIRKAELNLSLKQQLISLLQEIQALPENPDEGNLQLLQGRLEQALAAVVNQRSEQSVAKIAHDPAMLDKIEYHELHGLSERSGAGLRAANIRKLSKEQQEKLTEIARNPSQLDKMSFAELGDLEA